MKFDAYILILLDTFTGLLKERVINPILEISVMKGGYSLESLSFSLIIAPESMALA